MEWKDFIGNGEIVNRLQRLLQEKKMPHAILLAGPRGIGKFLAAEMVAAALFFGSERFHDRVGSHPDVIFVRPDGQAIKIEQIRRLQAEAALTPQRANERIVLIDEAEKMTVQSQNSLLKSLEEPAGNVRFFLIASNRASLLDTILSRCVTFDFQPIEKNALSLHLQRSFAVAAKQADALAMLAGGSLGRAESLVREDALTAREEAFSLLDGLGEARTSAQALWKYSAEFSSYDRMRLQLILETLVTVWRDLLVAGSADDGKLLYHVDKRERLLAWSALWPRRKIFGALELTKKALRALQANGNPLLLLERFMIETTSL